MLSLALAATLIGFVLLVLGLITGTVWLAITCIIVCLLGLAFLITDIVGSGRRADDDADSGSFAGLGSFDRDSRDSGSLDSGAYDSDPVPGDPRRGFTESSGGPDTGSGPLTAMAEDGTRRLVKQDQPPVEQQGSPDTPAAGAARPYDQQAPRSDQSGRLRAGPASSGQVARPAAPGVEGDYGDYLRSVGGVPEPGPRPQSGPIPQTGSASGPASNPPLGPNGPQPGPRGPRPGADQQRYVPAPGPGGPRPQQAPRQTGQQPRTGQPSPQGRTGPAQGFVPGQSRPQSPGQPSGQGQQAQRGPQPPPANRPGPSAPYSEQVPAQNPQHGPGTGSPGTGRRRKIDPLDPEWRPGN